MVIKKLYIKAFYANVVVFITLILLSGNVSASIIQKEKEDYVSVELISSSDALGETGEIQLGLWFKMAPDWKIYWRSPGAAGYPPRLDWNGSLNFTEAGISWPVPHRFEVFGISTLGYSKEVVLPIKVKVKDPAQPFHAELAIDYLICSLDTCITKNITLQLDLPTGDASPSVNDNIIQRYLSLVPRHETEGSFSIERVAVDDPNSSPPMLLVKVYSDDGFSNPELFIEGEEDIFFNTPKLQLSEDRKIANFSAAIYEDDSMEPSILPNILENYITLTINDSGYAIEAKKNIIKTPITFAEFMGMLGIALIGGFILNFMPCVLPVLSMKILSMVEDSGQSRRLIRLDFGATTLGVLASFFVLALGAIALKSLGASVGWGMHFQQPLFIIGMSVVITLFACNMWGFFEIGMPFSVTDRIINYKPTHRFTEHFSTGVFATLLATPCSAPFVGTALSFALSRDATEIILVFLTMGVGLSFPYILIALFPKIESKLPKPGMWLLTFRKVLGWILAATVLWLLWVLASQKGLPLATGVAILMLSIVGLFAIRRFFPVRLQSTIWGGVIGIALSVMIMPRYFDASANDQNYDSLWQPFDKKAIAKLVAEDKLVFVDVTAQWCLTCKVNKNFVLNTDDIVTRLSADHVVAMRWDWTMPDKNIDIYLNGFGRYGIPFNVVYGKGEPNGLVLPELLTKDAITNAMEQARNQQVSANEESIPNP